MKNIYKVLIISILLSVTALYFATKGQLNFDNISKLVNINFVGICLLVGSLILWWFLGGLRMRILANQLNGPIKLRKCIQAYLLSLFSAIVTPSATGAGVATGWYLSRYIGSRKSSAIAIYSIVLDLVFYAWSLPVSFFILQASKVALPIQGIGIYMFSATAIFLFLAWSLTYRISTLARLIWLLFSLKFLLRWRRQVYSAVYRMGSALLDISRTPWLIQVLLHLVTTAIFIVHYFVLNAAAIALGFDIPHVAILALQTLIVSLSFLIPTPGGSGYFEAMLALTLTGIVPKGSEALLIILWRVFSYYIYFLIGLPLGGVILIRSNQNNEQNKIKNEGNSK